MESRDVDAGDRDGAVGRGQPPGEAELVEGGVDVADAAEAMTGELGVDSGDHRADPAWNAASNSGSM